MDSRVGRPVYISPPPVRKEKAAGLAGAAKAFSEAAEAFSRKAEEVSAEKVNGMREPNRTKRKNLFSRKITWVEKIKVKLLKTKCRITIGFNKFRLFCHFYSGPEGRVELKNSISTTKSELDNLDNKLSCATNLERAQEHFNDGEYGKAFRSGIKAVPSGLKLLVNGACS